MARNPSQPPHHASMTGKFEAQPVVWKGHREFRHDLFKLEVKEMKKNVSYKKYEPDLQSVEHAHFYHSVDMKGRPNKYSAAVGGHFHEVIVEHDEQGNIVGAKCGPALRESQKKLKNGRVKTVIEPVKFAKADYDAEDPEEAAEAVKYIHDEHVHPLRYMHSEMISPDKIRQKQEADSSRLAKMMQADPNIVQGSQSRKTEPEGDGGEVGETKLESADA